MRNCIESGDDLYPAVSGSCLRALEQGGFRWKSDRLAIHKQTFFFIVLLASWGWDMRKKIPISVAKCERRSSCIELLVNGNRLVCSAPGFDVACVSSRIPSSAIPASESSIMQVVTPAHCRRHRASCRQRFPLPSPPCKLSLRRIVGGIAHVSNDGDGSSKSAAGRLVIMLNTSSPFIYLLHTVAAIIGIVG